MMILPRGRRVLLLSWLGLVACQPLVSGGPGLFDTVWGVTELHGEAFTPPPGRPFFLQLHSDGRLSGFAGCNSLGGGYQHGRRGVLRVGPFDSIRTFCAPDVMRREKSVVMAMEGASSYTLEDGVLSLRNPLGIVLVRFRALGPAEMTPPDGR